MRKMNSFFDEISAFWSQRLPLYQQPDLEMMLSYKSKKSQLFKAKKFNFSLNYLIKIGKDGKERSCLNLENITIERIIPQELNQSPTKNQTPNTKSLSQGIRLQKNGQVAEFFTKTEEQTDQLFEYIKQYAVQTNFHENFQLGKKIGQGNFAKVYVARSVHSGQEYGVKVFQKSSFKNIQIDKPALVKEISILRKMSHQGVIKLHEVYENENFIYLVKELLKGGELFQKLKKHTSYSEKYAAQIIFRLLSALDYVHAKNILHRDIKPENLILRSKNNDFDICLADFGLADYYDPEGNYMFKRCGTPGYVAPELLQDKIYNNKIDIFSVGTIMFLLLSGYQTFRGASYDEVVIKNYNCDIDYMDLEKKLSPPAYNLLRLLLNKNPKLRPSAKEALKHEWFDKVLGKEEISSTLRIYSEIIKITPDQNTELYSRTPIMGQGSGTSSPAMTTPTNAITPQVTPNARAGNMSFTKAAAMTVTQMMRGKKQHASFLSPPSQKLYGMHSIVEEDPHVVRDDTEEPQAGSRMGRYSVNARLKKSGATDSLKLPSISNTPKPRNKASLTDGPLSQSYQKTKNVRTNLKVFS